MTKLLLVLLILPSLLLLGATSRTTLDQAVVQESTPKEICVSNWGWYPETDAKRRNWDSPWRDNTIGARLDLRTKFQYDEPGEIAGYGIFVLDELLLCKGARVLVALPADLDKELTGQEKTALEVGLGLDNAAITANTTREVIFSLFTSLASERGVTSIIPNRKRELSLYLGPWKLKSERVLDFTNHAYILTTIQEQYRVIRENTLRGDNPPKHYSRFLTLQLERYKTKDWQQFIPSDLPKETPLPVASVIGDTFVEGSDTALESHTATGPNGGFSWSRMTESGGGTAEVVAATDNVFVTNTSPGVFRAESALDSGNHACDMDVNIGSGGARRRISVLTNFNGTGVNAAAEDYYQFRVNDDVGDFEIVEVTNSSEVILNSVTDTISGTQNLKGENDGGTLTLYIDDVSKLTASDATFGAVLETGIAIRKADTSNLFADNYECSDLAAPTRRMITF